MNGDDDLDGTWATLDQMTTIRWEFGDLNCTVQMAQNLSPDMIDDILLKGRRAFIAAARQLGVVEAVDIGD